MLIANQIKDLIASVHLQADNSQVATGTMFAVIRLESSDADDGKYWDGAAWAVLPAPFPSAAHTEAGMWSYALPAAATLGKAGAWIHFTFTDHNTEVSATTYCHGGEHLILAGLPAVEPAGSKTITITVNDGVPAIVPGITVDIYDASNVVHLARFVDTDLDGIVAANLDPGTYKVRLLGSGFTPTTNPETLVVTVDAAVTYTGTQISTPAAANPILCTVYGYVMDAEGTAKDGETISFLGEVPTSATPNQATRHKIDIVTGPTVANPAWASGYFELDLIRLTQVRVRASKLGLHNLVITVPDKASEEFAVLSAAALT